MGSSHPAGDVFKTRVLPVTATATDLGHFENAASLEKWVLPTTGLEPLQEAARHLKSSSIPVGFPTETVYGLGADATRSEAVKGIYKAKGRPSDNPLIVHVCDLTMLRSLVASPEHPSPSTDPIPAIYKPLIKKFWPGPLTILLPNPNPSKLAPEVTAGLPSFGARMPESPLALSLICLAGAPLAAPSANASTKPSPTTAEHVLHDLDGRIEVILDGGPCQVGVESTVVDGLCDPPLVLRPGGISIDRIRECEGWEGELRGYKDACEVGADAPRAPGMKYKHYSPKAKVVLYEANSRRDSDGGRASLPREAWSIVTAKDRQIAHLGYELLDRPANIGIVSTRNWNDWAGFHAAKWSIDDMDVFTKIVHRQTIETCNSFLMQQGELWQGGTGPMPYLHGGRGPPAWTEPPHNTTQAVIDSLQQSGSGSGDRHVANVIEISLGKETKDIAHGLFSALRELDQRGVDVIYVEGIEDEGDIAAAVMNRLRKAAAVIEG